MSVYYNLTNAVIRGKINHFNLSIHLNTKFPNLKSRT